MKWATLNISLLVTAMVIIAFVVAPFILGGCANTYAADKQAVIATDAAVVTASTLRSTGVITSADTVPVLIAARTLYTAESTWKNALDSGDKNAATTAQQTVSSSLATLSAQLVALQATKQLQLHPAVGRERLTVKAVSAPAGMPPADRKKIGEISAAIAIIQLAADLTPQVVNWINASSAASSVTSADVQAALDTLARDIDVLAAAVTSGSPLTQPS